MQNVDKIRSIDWENLLESNTETLQEPTGPNLSLAEVRKEIVKQVPTTWGELSDRNTTNWDDMAERIGLLRAAMHDVQERWEAEGVH